MTQREIRTHDSPSVAVITAVADRLDADPTTLEPPLATAIDPDALDRVVEYEDVEVSFRYNGFRVRVESSTAVELEPV